MFRHPEDGFIRKPKHVANMIICFSVIFYIIKIVLGWTRVYILLNRVHAALIWVEDILSIGCESWLHKQYKRNSYWIENMYFKRIMTAVNEILHKWTI